MKKLVLTTWMLMSATLLMAGGDLSPKLSEVADISAQNCETNNVYIEEDVNLMWQDQAYVDAEDGAYKQEYSSGKAGKWKHATNYCRTLNYSGFVDWRLPTSDELQHLHRIPGEVFINSRGQDFWSTTPASKGKYYAVYPADAYRYAHNAKRSNYIRCVRCLNPGDTEMGSEIIE